MHDPKHSSTVAADAQSPMSHSAASIGCSIPGADAELVLMANRLAWWPAEKLLLVADCHFGKAATFRKAGLPVPAGTTSRMIDALSKAINELQPSRLVILGDFIHSATSSHNDFERELSAWRQSHASLPITLILGNHDRNRRRLFEQLHLDVCDEEACGPFLFCHDPFALRTSPRRHFRVAGHIHPGVRLGKDSQRMPCFWMGEQFLVLPAFGAFTGLAKISPNASDVLFPVCDDQITRVPGSSLAWQRSK